MLAYWKRAILRAHQDTLHLLGVGSTTRGRVLASILIYVSAILLIGVLGGNTEMAGEARWGVAIILATLGMYVPFFMYHLAAAPERLQAESEHRAMGAITTAQQELADVREELARHLSKELRIVFGEGHPFEQWGPGMYHGFRVGVEAAGGRTVEDVHVELVAMDPPENAYLPVILHLKGNDPPQEPRFRFNLHPGEREYVDVVYNFDDEPNKMFVLCYADRAKPNRMPAKPYPYRLTLRAFGRDVKAVERYFTMTVDQKGRFEMRSEERLAKEK